MRTRRATHSFAILLVGSISTQCQRLAGYEEFSAAPSEPPSPCAVLPKVKEDALGLSVMSRVDIPNGTCFWIDQQEVTVAAYERWQDEVSADQADWEPTFCRWKGTRSDPISDSSDSCRAQILPFDLVPFGPSKPMRCVDFCEAEAFCRWGKKHLCHATDAFGVQEPRTSVREWALACSNVFSTVFPWGNEPRAELCNVGQSGDTCFNSARAVCGALTVGEKSGCVTKSGVVDLLGNVAEWVYSCNFVDERDPAPTGCMIRGGGYDESLRSCGDEATVANDTRKPSIGFRCCADLTDAETISVKNSSGK